MISGKHAEAARLIDCTEREHSAAILAIINEAIVNSTAIYDYELRTAESMVNWFASKRIGGYPVIGAVDVHGSLLAFATWGPFRSFPAYKYTVEHSVYVENKYRGRGLGKLLLRELIHRAEKSQLHVMVACIDASNAASISLHTQLGFTHAGTIKEVGFKFGNWVDAAFYELKLQTPLEPKDGIP